MRESAKLKEMTDWKDRARAACYDAKLLANSCEVDDRALECFFSDTVGMRPQEWLDALREMDAYVTRHPEPKDAEVTADILIARRAADAAH